MSHFSFFSTFTVTAVLLFAACSDKASADIVSGPFTNPSNNHTYYLLAPASWSASQAEAESLGGNLVTIRNFDEQLWLQQTFGPINSDFSPNSFWIGFTDQDSEGNWGWISGEPVTFSNFALGEPNGGTASNWAYIGRYASGGWNDIEDIGTGDGQPQPRGVVEITAVPEPGSLLMLTVVSTIAMTYRRRSRVFGVNQ